MKNKTVSITVRLLAAINYIQGTTRAQIAPASRHEIMKPKNLLLLPALIAVLNLLPVGQAPGQTFTTLYTIDPDEGSPAGLVLSSNTLYGTTSDYVEEDPDLGEYLGYGEVFAVGTDGTDPRVLVNQPGAGTGLTLSGSTLYVTSIGETPSYIGDCYIFAVNTDGTGSRIVYTFTPTSGGYIPYVNDDGWGPMGGVTVSGATLYGTTSAGGTIGGGTIFKVSTNGTGFTVLTNWSEESDFGLILSGDTLYGIGSLGLGGTAVFAVNTNGTGLTNLLSVPDYGTLVLSGSTLYGVEGGVGSPVFAVNTNGTGFRLLHTFTSVSGDPGTNSDGANVVGLVVNGSILYGMANSGGSSGLGTVFAMSTNGTGFTNLYNFTGAQPNAGLILSGNTFYGTISAGTVFSLSFAPQLTITPSGTHVILSWPTNAAGFDYTGYVLQSAGNLVSPAVWSTNLPAPVVIAGRNTVTNEITVARQFYRLIR